MAKLSPSLERLTASFLVDAKDFFHACKPAFFWRDLVSLTLTSRLLEPNADPAKINAMLYAAGAAAQKMPRLRAMEIWNGRHQVVSILRYRFDNYYPALTMKSSWDLRLEPRVLEAWQGVATSCCNRKLQVDEGRLAASDIGCHGDVVEHPLLTQDEPHPVSLKQIRIETARVYKAFE